MSLNPENNMHQRWMRRALRLASRSLGACGPNPGVAACIVRDGLLLGEGRHQFCGGDHAEVAALKDCRQRGHDARGADIYVTLAPCTSQGRTPACTMAIIQAGIARVYAAIEDPHQDTATEVLQQAGIQYETGLCAEVAAHIHGGFLQRCLSGRPRITGKWAMSVDGHIACSNGQSSWLSSAEALALSRRRRRVFDAIVIGSGTFCADDPQLLAHGRKSPKRVIIAGAAMPHFTGTRILQRIDDAPVYCLHSSDDSVAITQAQNVGVHCHHIKAGESLIPHVKFLMDLGCNEVLVEGGSHIHSSFLREQLYDRLDIYNCARSLGAGMPVATGEGVERVALGDRWQLEQAPLLLGDTVCMRYRSLS